MKTNSLFTLKTGIKLAVVLSLLSYIFFSVPASINARDQKFVSEQSMTISAKPLDQRARILQNYLQKYNSPLADYAQDFIEAADKYDVDWKLVPAIAGVESTFGRFIPGGYNAWGWGVYGDQSLGFASWKDGIYTLNKGLKENYINRGLTEPYAMNRVYASSPTWGTKVSYFLQDLEKFAKSFNSGPKVENLSLLNEEKEAGDSATLLFN